jgi:phosphoserine phosphatase RsbU/P
MAASSGCGPPTSRTIGGHTTVVISSVPIQERKRGGLREGAGRVTIYPVDLAEENAPAHSVEFAPSGGPAILHIQINGEDVDRPQKRDHRRDRCRPRCISTMCPSASVPRWPPPTGAMGKPLSTYSDVTSRPSLLYRRLFITSLSIGDLVREMLIAIAIAFGVLELLAFLAAVRLNQTITRSVHDLYEATLAIDGGNLEHRIKVKRTDQLGALSRSFNSMASLAGAAPGGTARKAAHAERAFDCPGGAGESVPARTIALPMLELHGVCLPARTVSGDYYDFLLFGKTGLGVALGDISGKGISAALLMATLHSAVRAYRFASEELITEGAAALSNPRTRHEGEQEVECAELFEEPAKILSLLNRHLYRSTQPEKYATLCSLPLRKPQPPAGLLQRRPFAPAAAARQRHRHAPRPRRIGGRPARWAGVGAGNRSPRRGRYSHRL